jgi:glutaredoxin
MKEKVKNILNRGMLFWIAVILVISGVVILAVNKSNCSTDLSDAEKFAKEYTNVTSDNVFVYRDIDEIITILEHGTGIVYLGFPTCPWCQAYVAYLNDAAKTAGITKIYYYNIYNDRKNNTEAYQKIVSILTGHLQYDSEGKERIYVPSVTAVKNGTIVGYDDETSLDTGGFDKPSDYWTTDKIGNLKERLVKMMEAAEDNICTECNK